MKIFILGVSLLLINSFTSGTFTSGNPTWLNSFEDAKTVATKEDKLILMVFSGSDWCRGCILLDQEVFSGQEFEEIANENLVLVKADFPRKRKNQLPADQQMNNAQLAQKFNTEGAFPKVLLMDANEKIFFTSGYQQGQKHEFLNSLRSYL